MNSSSCGLFSSPQFHFVSCFILFLMLNQIPCSTSHPVGIYKVCTKFKFTCGNVSAGFPFWVKERQPTIYGHPCLKLKCHEDVATIKIDGIERQVLDIDVDVVKVVTTPDCDNNGSYRLANSLFNTKMFVDFSSGYPNVPVFFGCTTTPLSPDHGSCLGNTFNNVTLLVPQSRFSDKERADLLRNPFEEIWKMDGKACDGCFALRRNCSSGDLKQPCDCQQLFAFKQPPFDPRPPPQKGDEKDKKKKLLIGFGITGATIGVISLIIGFLLIRQRTKRAAQFNPEAETSATSSYSQNNHSILFKPDLENSISYYFGAQVFTYAELEEATNNFDSSKELGNGGFGTVYYGVLNDGRTIAVKRMYASNLKRINQFTNEVMILTRLRHPNLVTLFGCTSRHSRELLLVYEHVPNGTLADHLHGNRTNSSSSLTWSLRLKIAIQTATSLSYLHKSDVIHRDVKTNNILLDDNFSVKVGDFGLSRLFPGNVTHISTAPQGTPGYFDPEYFRCFQLSEKSDVYSFGVVLMELISGEKAVDMNRQRGDINLSDMALKRIGNGTLHEIVDSSIGSDFETRKAITLVGDLAFECLKQERDMRPSMDEVVETLRRIENDDVVGTLIEEVMV